MFNFDLVAKIRRSVGIRSLAEMQIHRGQKQNKTKTGDIPAIIIETAGMSQARGNVAGATFPRTCDIPAVEASRECRLRRSRELRHSRAPQGVCESVSYHNHPS